MENRLRLVIQSVRRDYRVNHPLHDQLLKTAIAKVASRLFERLPVVCRGRGRVDPMQVEGQIKGGGQLLDKGCVGIRLGTANAVVDMDQGQDQAKPGPLLQQAAQQSDRIGASRDGYGNPLSSVKETGVK
jgi:hypothetical protein